MNEGYQTRWKLKGRKWSLYLMEFVNARNEWKMQIKPTKTNNLIYIMIFFWGGGGKRKSRAKLKKFIPPPQNPYLRPCKIQVSIMCTCGIFSVSIPQTGKKSGFNSFSRKLSSLYWSISLLPTSLTYSN